MSRVARRAGIAIVVVVALLFMLSFFVDANRFRPALESRLSAALGREVKVGDLRLSIFSGSVTANDLAIADDPKFSKSPFLRAKSLHAQVELMPLIFSRKLNLTGLTIDQPEIDLVQTPSGDWNFSSLGASSSPKPAAAPASSGSSGLDLSLKNVKITNGRFTLGRTVPHWAPLVLEKVDVNVTDFSNTSAFPFSVRSTVGGGGTINLDGKAGPLNPADAAMTPVKATLNVSQLNLAGPGVNNLAPGIAGIVSFDGTGDSDGKLARIDGKVKAEKLKLAKNGAPSASPLEFDFSAQQDMKAHSGVLSRGDIHIGKASANVAGNYAEQGGALVLHMNLNGSNMALPDLEGALSAVGVVLPAGSTLRGGTLSTKMSFEGPADKLVSTGSVAINGARLSGFDLGSKMSAIAALAGIKTGGDTEVQSASANIHASPEGTNVQDIHVVAPGIGDLSGGGAISPANALNFSMSAAIHAQGLAAQLTNKPIPFLVEGTASNPIFKANVQAVVTQQLNRQLDRIPANNPAGNIIKGLLGGK